MARLDGEKGPLLARISIKHLIGGFGGKYLVQARLNNVTRQLSQAFAFAGAKCVNYGMRGIVLLVDLHIAIVHKLLEGEQSQDNFIGDTPALPYRDDLLNRSQVLFWI